MQPPTPRQLSRQTISAGKFLNFEAIKWLNARGQERIWEMASRTADTPAVMLIARLVPSRRLVLIRQYRPPANARLIEFPAGLVDPAETPEQAAIRELREETGYHGKVTRLFPPAYNTPGLSNESAYPVLLEIDERDPRNANPTPTPDQDEQIDVVLVEPNGFSAFLREQDAAGARFDTKVVAYLLAAGDGQ
jgi:ADP-ribose pyrophosphatase